MKMISVTEDSVYLIILANSADPYEMSHFVVFHLGLHSLPKYTFMDFQW